MSNLKIDSSRDVEILKVQFTGAMNEESMLSCIDVSGLKEIHIDWSGLSSINSCGIREWIKWIGALYFPYLTRAPGGDTRWLEEQD